VLFALDDDGLGTLVDHQIDHVTQRLDDLERAAAQVVYSSHGGTPAANRAHGTQSTRQPYETLYRGEPRRRARRG
jgi:hypothetical protein